jgi:hypothetical protein
VEADLAAGALLGRLDGRHDPRLLVAAEELAGHAAAIRHVTNLRSRRRRR